jgi:hypothetical protein
MTDIQITDFNPTDFNPSDIELCEELTDEELLAVNGGGGWLSDKLHDAANAIDHAGDVVAGWIQAAL